tara:strand:+ start:296 stop:457 length:162 start_codon:yes stop_codon:yes gene_type:complete
MNNKELLAYIAIIPISLWLFIWLLGGISMNVPQHYNPSCKQVQIVLEELLKNE